MQITKNIFVETKYFGANVGFVTTSDGIVMIDTPQRPTDTVVWKKELRSKGKIRFLINTEPHGDHITGNFFFDIPIIAQEKTREAILKKNPNHILKGIAEIDKAGLSLVKNYKINAPTITFMERLTLYLGGLSFHLIHLPGHTLGQTAIYIPEEKTVFTGDNVYGNIQILFHEADPFAWLESIAKLNELDVEYIIPGHGEICSKKCLAEHAKYIQKCVDIVKDVINRGWSKKEAVAKISLPLYYKFPIGLEKIWAEKLTESVANLYDYLSGK